MCFHTKYPLDNLCLKVNCVKIVQVYKYMYLGSVRDNKINFKEHIKNLKMKTK